MNTSIVDKLLSDLALSPILVDIGASGSYPAIWKPIMAHAVYIGFDPDAREIRDVSNVGFKRAVIINKTITEASDQNAMTFFLTRSPYCSSTLAPDTESLSNYLYADLFRVVNQKTVDAITLNKALVQLDLNEVHWLKLDSQGTDLRIFNSLSSEIRDSVLAIDVEPGIIDAYQGEDFFVDVHRDLVKQGFWLSDANVLGSVRVHQQTLSQFPHLQAGLERVRQTPGWIEARYLRSLHSMAQQDYRQADYSLLWIFAMLDGQYGYALDTVGAYQRRFGDDEKCRAMQEETVRVLQNLRPSAIVTFVKSLFPNALKREVKQLLAKLR